MSATASAPGGAARPHAAGILPIIAYIALCTIWGSTYLAIRYAVQGFPPHLMVGARSVLAGAVMLGVALAQGTRLPGRAGWLGAAASGLLLFTGGQAFLAFAETRVFSGQAAVIGATQALIMPLAAWGLGAARAPSAATWAGLVAGLVGVVILVNPGGHALDPLGAAGVMASVLTWSAGSAMAKRFPVAGVAMSAGLQMLIGGAACLLLALPTGELAHFSLAAVPRSAWLGFAYLATMGSLGGFTAFAYLVQVWPPERMATYTYVNPIVALLLGTLIAGEALSARDLLATLIILAAVALVMFGDKLRRR